MRAGLFRLIFGNNSLDLEARNYPSLRAKHRADSDALIVAAAYYLPAGDAESVA